MRKFLRRWLFALAVLALVCAVLVAAFYVEEDRRGAHVWDDCRRDLQAHGEPLDAAAVIPPPIPDDQNLAMAPLFVRTFRYCVDPATHVLTFPRGLDETAFRDEIFTMPLGVGTPAGASPVSAGNWTLARPIDLTQWQQYYARQPDFPHASRPQSPADDVLLALTRYAPILDELAQAAATRPLTRFPVNWTQGPPWDIAMPQGRALQALTATLRLRAVAELALERNEEAMRDVALMKRLCDAEAVDPVFIALLVTQVQASSMLQPIWEGLRARRWPAAELGQLQRALRDIDFLAQFQWAARGERAHFVGGVLDRIKARGGAVAWFNRRR